MKYNTDIYFSTQIFGTVPLHLIFVYNSSYKREFVNIKLKSWCISFQSESPSGDTMNALGLYLLISLFFVVGTLLELASVLEVRRDCERKMKTQVQPQAQAIKVKGLNQKDAPELDKTNLKTEKIDRIAFISYIILYSLFNLIYWTHFLT